MNEDMKSLKESIDTLIDENERLRKRIETLEADKKAVDTENDAVNAFEKDAAKILEKLLKDYKPKHNEQVYNPDELDWSYKPSRTRPIEVGDWPPGPQIGDPSWTPNDYPYWPFSGGWWGIYPPPYWCGYKRTCVTTNDSGDPVKQYNYTTSKDGEN